MVCADRLPDRFEHIIDVRHEQTAVFAAEALGVARNTVLWAVQRLQAEGYVEARVGDGTYVSQAAAAAPAHGLVAPPRGLSRRGQLIADTAARWRPPHVAARAFRIGAPEVDTFPFALWDRLARQASSAQRSARAQYLDPAGDPGLRQAVALWLWASRGIRCDAAQVVVCAGSASALSGSDAPGSVSQAW